MKSQFKTNKFSRIKQQTRALLLAVSASLFAAPIQAEIQTTKPADATLLGLVLAKTDQEAVRDHLQNLGGFKPEFPRLHRPNIDKFFTVSNQRDSYYFEFRYDANGKVVAAKRLYRIGGKELINEYRDLTTTDLAREMIKTFGQPNQIIRKARDGRQAYPAYVWFDDEMTITLDHRGSDFSAPIFVEYQLNRNPFVEKTEAE